MFFLLSYTNLKKNNNNIKKTIIQSRVNDKTMNKTNTVYTFLLPDDMNTGEEECIKKRGTDSHRESRRKQFYP